ncbi:MULTISPECIES: hypothetical protein [Planktothrix]|nr:MULTISPECIES: hypothetical protein [Planktothrix]
MAKCVLSAEKSCEISVKAMRIPVMHFMTGTECQVKLNGRT